VFNVKETAVGTITIDMSLRHEFDRRWRAYVRSKEQGIRSAGDISIIIDPAMQGPNSDGRIVYHQVDPGFLEVLREDNFGD
jgi:hypothetical protein